VHVGADDADIETARELVGPDRLIGVSCYGTLERAYAAVEAGADYVAFGSFFESATKPAAQRADVGVLRRARSLAVPVVAIGGITASNAPLLIDAGATAVAVISDVFASDDSAAITRASAAIARAFATESSLQSRSR